MTRFLSLFFLLCGTILLCHCDDSSRKNGVGWTSPAPEGTLPPGFEGFTDRWNKETERWLQQRQHTLTTSLEQAKKSGEQTEPILSQITLNEQRLKDGNYLEILPKESLDPTLIWEEGMNEPEVGDPAAKKGGTVNLFSDTAYPDTFRPFGPNSNNSFRGVLYDDFEFGLIGLHPATGKVIPGLADRWAIGKDGRTVYYHLNPKASYSDGVKVRTIDFIVNIFLRTSEYSDSVFYSDFYRENVSKISLIGDDIIAITLPSPRPILPYYAAAVTPAPSHFYSEFGPNYVENYQWRIPPTTGAYTVLPEGVIRGRQVTLQRVKNWWAKDNKYVKYAFNADFIVHNIIGQESKVIELFRVGQLDMMAVNRPELFHDRMEIAEVHKGYIEKATFYNLYPRVPTGFFLNVAIPPFNNKNIRIGFQYAMNIQGIIESVYRGDFQRLNTYASGYGRYSNPCIQARPYNPEKARKAFYEAGYTRTDKEGYLCTPQGKRLSIEVCYGTGSPIFATAMSKLKEDAKKCGVELQLDALDSTVFFRKVIEKRHQSAWWGWGFSPPIPSLHQGFHSCFALDGKGKPKPNTNNICSFASEEMDQALLEERNANTEEEAEQASHKIQQIIHNEALWIPGWTAEFVRVAYWRWIRWPNSATTKFCAPRYYDTITSYLYWVDEEMKKETLEAKHSGKSFREVDAVYPLNLAP